MACNDVCKQDSVSYKDICCLLLFSKIRIQIVVSAVLYCPLDTYVRLHCFIFIFKTLLYLSMCLNNYMI